MGPIVAPPPPPPPAPAPYVAPTSYGVDPAIQAAMNARQTPAPTPVASAPPPPPAPPVAYPSASPLPPTISNIQQLNALEAQYNQPISSPGTVTTLAPTASVNMPPPPAPVPVGNATPNYDVPDPFSKAQQQFIPPAPPPAPAPTPSPAPAPSSAPVPAATPPSGITPEQAAAWGIDPAIYAAMNSPAGLAAATLPGTNTPAHPELQPGANIPLDPAIQNAINNQPAATPAPTVNPSTGVVNAPAFDPGAQGTGTANDPNVVFANDPVYLASQQENQLARKNAAGNYLEGLKTLLLQFGDVNLAHQVLDGIGGQVQQYLGSAPDLTSYFAQFNGIDNPDTSFSQMAQYNRMIREGLKNTTEGVNNAGLYYSGAGAKAMADFQYQSQAKLQAMLSSTRAAVAQLGQDFFGRLQGAQASDISAMNDAYNRQVQQALNGQFDLSGLSGLSGVTTGGTPAGAVTASGTKPAPPKPPSVKTKAVVKKTLGNTNRSAAVPVKKTPTIAKPKVIAANKRTSRG